MALSTGISVLDRRLDGGFREGSIVALSTPPEAQSTVLLSTLADTHPTTYLSTLRPAEEVREGLPDSDVEAVYDHPQSFLSDPEAALSSVREGSIVIVDPVNGMEHREHRDGYVDFLGALKSRLVETGSVAVLHALEPERTPELRWLTLARADAAWRISLVVMPLAIESRLVISKIRGGRPPDEPLKLRLTDRITVDTSRSI